MKAILIPELTLCKRREKTQEAEWIEQYSMSISYYFYDILHENIYLEASNASG